MKKALLSAVVFLAVLGLAHPPAAEARVFVSGGFGGGYYGGYPYPAYYAPYYVAPPPVVYAVPPAPVYYAQPAYAQPTAVPAAAPPPQAYDAPPSAPQSSAAFVDSQGRTCRHVQITSAADTVCLQPDGSWRTVQ